MTNEVGAPVKDNRNSLTAGERGPMLLEDLWMMEKMAHFDREVIPERRMHAKGRMCGDLPPLRARGALQYAEGAKQGSLCKRRR